MRSGLDFMILLLVVSRVDGGHFKVGDAARARKTL